MSDSRQMEAARLRGWGHVATVVAMVIAGCGGLSTAAPPGGGDDADGSAGQDATPWTGDASSLDAAADAVLDAAADAVVSQDASSGAFCPSRSGYFACENNVCSRAVQACTAGTCEGYAQLAPACGPCPTCACLTASANTVLASCTDDGAGGVTFTVRPPGPDGSSCRTDSDCWQGLCQNEVCLCTPAGSVPNSVNAVDSCCSKDYSFGKCAAQAGVSECTTRVQDCFGGECVGGICACVGAGGDCLKDADCCAGATKCVNNTCQ
jgi:hypothetical protein